MDLKHHDEDEYQKYATLAHLSYEKVRDRYESWWNHYFSLKNRKWNH